MCCSSFQIPPYNYLSFAIVSFHPVDAFFSRWFIFLRRVGRLLPLEPLRLGLTDSEANAFSEAGSPARLGVAFVAPADPHKVRDFPLSLSCGAQLLLPPGAAEFRGCCPRRRGGGVSSETSTGRGAEGGPEPPGRAGRGCSSSGRDGAVQPTLPRAPCAPTWRSACAYPPAVWRAPRSLNAHEPPSWRRSQARA